ncbi:MAG: transporter [Rhodospirillales bacterium]|nr:transporter [Rhodospirillales bacterium]
MTWRGIRRVWLLRLAITLVLTLATAGPVLAQLTFPGASPISAGNLILMAQPTLVQQTGFQSATAQGVLVYGASSKLALITESNLLVWNMAEAVSGGKTVRLDAVGTGDTLQEARYTVFQLDGIGSTLRIAPMIGVTVPTGMDNVNSQLPHDVQPATGNWGGRAALTGSWQTLRWNAEAEIGYEARFPGTDYQFGNQFVTDAAFHYVIWPRQISADIPGELFASLETNFFSANANRVNGAFVPGTGGQLWLVDPGLDWSTPGYGLAITALLPVLQTRYGSGRRYDYGVLLHFRLSLYTPHHW